ncbi:MAG: KTSC domain-containing protein [Kiritimatiellae bacterium]|nr:KTSC domain-containing protein [Kiritimatiellia bacterium]
MAASGKMIGIVAGAVVVLLLVACGGLVFLNQQQAQRAAGLEDAVLKTAAAAGIEDLTPEGLKDAAALQRVQDTVQAQRQELGTTKEALTTAGTEAANAKAEAAAQVQKAQEQAARVTELTEQMAAKDTELSTAKAAAAKAEQEKTALQQETAKLKADAEAAQKKLAEIEAAAAPAATGGEGEAAVEVAGAAEEPAVAAEAAEEPAEEPEPAGRDIGKSEMFRSIKYTAADQVLVLKLADGQKLTYKDVPETVYGGMLNSTDIDKYYRFKIQGVFSSTPEDKQAIRDFWRNINNRPVRGDLKVIE